MTVLSVPDSLSTIRVNTECICPQVNKAAPRRGGLGASGAGVGGLGAGGAGLGGMGSSMPVGDGGGGGHSSSLSGHWGWLTPLEVERRRKKAEEDARDPNSIDFCSLGAFLGPFLVF